MLRRIWLQLFPASFYYADHLTVSAKRLFWRVGIGFVGIVAGAAAAGLIDSSNWRDLAAGALLAWSVSIVAWAVSSYQRGRSETYAEIRRTAEVDLLHAWLNQIAARVGAPPLLLDSELEHAISARTERLAHFAGLDEFREQAQAHAGETSFWDEEALGHPLEPGYLPSDP